MSIFGQPDVAQARKANRLVLRFTDHASHYLALGMHASLAGALANAEKARELRDDAMRGARRYLGAMADLRRNMGVSIGMVVLCLAGGLWLWLAN